MRDVHHSGRYGNTILAQLKMRGRRQGAGASETAAGPSAGILSPAGRPPPRERDKGRP
jgi:hypothetical protein